MESSRCWRKLTFSTRQSQIKLRKNRTPLIFLVVVNFYTTFAAMYAVAAKSCKMNMFKVVVQTKVMNKKTLPVTCKIVLNKNKTVYNPGNEILGHVQVDFNDEFVYYGIKLVLEGIVHVKYREDKKPYDKRDSILTESNYLVGDGGHQKIKSKPGTNSIYTFAIQIPSTDVPGTFQGPHGQVNYHLIVLIDYGENKLTKRAIKAITINGQLDLDPDDITNSEPITFENSYTTGVKQISHNKKIADPALRFTCELEQGGFICGENMDFELELENPKKKYKIKGITVGLIQRITYHVGGNAMKKTNTVLTSAVLPVPGTDPADFVPPSIENPWKGTLEIPRRLMPSLNGTIEFEYFLKVTIPLGNTKDILSGECLITMGTTRDGISAEGDQEATTFYTSNLEKSANGKHDSDDD